MKHPKAGGEPTGKSALRQRETEGEGDSTNFSGGSGGWGWGDYSLTWADGDI